MGSTRLASPSLHLGRDPGRATCPHAPATCPVVALNPSAVSPFIPGMRGRYRKWAVAAKWDPNPALAVAEALALPCAEAPSQLRGPHCPCAWSFLNSLEVIGEGGCEAPCPCHGSLECLSYKGPVAIWTRLPQMGKLREAKDILPRWADLKASREKSTLARRVEKYSGAAHMGSLAPDHCVWLQSLGLQCLMAIIMPHRVT